MLTRCPNCGTTFRLRAEQLEQAEGRVRCGKCSSAFVATEHRIDAESPDEPPTAAAPSTIEAFPPLPLAAAHFSAAGHRKRFVAQPEASTAEPEIASPADESAGGPHGAAPPITMLERAPAEATGEPGEPIAEETLVESTPEPDAQAVARPDGSNSAQSQGPMERAAEDVVTDEASRVQAPAAEQAPAQETPDTQSVPADPTDPAESTGSTGARLGEAAPPASDYLAGAGPARRWPLVAIAAFLGTALLLQIGYGYRTDLAKKHPGWRPALEGACEFFGCRVELPRDAERVSIESSDLNPESDKKRLYLTATLKNRAEYMQSYPHVELTLTDIRDQPLVRRVFTPSEYLTKEATPSFEPSAEIAIKLTLETDEINASGYRVYLFYP